MQSETLPSKHVAEQPHESPQGDTIGGEKSTTPAKFYRTPASTVTIELSPNIRASSRKRAIENFGRTTGSKPPMNAVRNLPAREVKAVQDMDCGAGR
jgi:hypothetical protein